MRELSLNILDIAKNSTKAGSTLIEIEVEIEEVEDLIKITIKDNGCGMTEEFLKTVVDPFSTTRTTRKVGMGIPLFLEACESTGGTFDIASKVNVGTVVVGTLGLSHIDRMPLGNLSDTMTILIMGDAETEFILKLKKAENEFVFDTREVKEILGESDLSSPTVITYLKEFLNENINNITGGNI
ncbi:MAG: ATP-binding protein [Clostridia bacterium]